MPIRVLHILGDSRREGTAIARIVQSLCRHTSHSDFELAACFVGADGPLNEEFKRCGIPTRVIAWKHPSRDILGTLRLASYLSSSHFDVLHFHWGGPRLRRIGKLASGAKVVFHLHSSIEETRDVRSADIPTHNSDAVIAVSKAVEASSKHPNTRVIYPGIEIPESVQRVEDPDLCGCATRLVPIKGVSHLLRAIALLKDRFPQLRLEVAGDGPARAELESEAAQLGISDRVKFLGWVDPWNQLRSRWAVMVHPSLQEGLPLSMLEAMADGTSIVASSVGGVPEVIFDGASGTLVPAADPAALASAISLLLKDPDRRNKLGTAAAQRVRESFSAKKMAAEISAVYRELL
jgi:glycosyltransferase involved in cell wall biosynthesis